MTEDTGADARGRARSGHGGPPADDPAGGPRPLEVPGPHRSIGERLAEVADALPDTVAVESAGRSYTYRDLMDGATASARALRHELDGDAPGRPVALEVESDARCVAAFVAIVLSGRPAVLLDPMLPEARSAQIVRRSGGRRMTPSQIGALPQDGPADLPDRGLDDPAVIIFTSGSTGEPKGVVHSHGSWLNQAYVGQETAGLAPGDRNALVLPMAFGAGLDIVFMSLLTGGTLVVHDPRVVGLPGLVDLLLDGRLDTLHTTPSLMVSIMDQMPEGRRMMGVRTATTCGEAIHSSVVARLRERLEPGATYVGWSGASEIGTLAHYPLPAGAPLPPGFIPVGRPAPNKRIEVVGEDGGALGPGQTGQVAITSRFLARGYFGDPELTRERFTPNPDGTTTYRGGDLGRWDDDGILHLRGRADLAVKIGGYLVEPAEIEAALLDIGQVREAAVAAVRPDADDSGGRARLIAYVAPEAAEHALTPAGIRRTLRERLPGWMVPGQIVLVDALPRTERGKVARDALAALAPAPVPYVEPTGTTERMLASIWEDVLGLQDVSANADFWELGADSLATEELLAAVDQATGVSLTAGHLLDAPTIAELALRVDRADESASTLPPTAVMLRRGSGGPWVFAFAGGGSPALALAPIASALCVDVPVCGFHAAGYASRAIPDWTLPRVVRRHLRTIRELSPHGPYVLMGHSFGGLVALETARILAAEGEDVPLVVTLDTILPDEVVGRAPARGADAPPRRAPTPLAPLRERLQMHARIAAHGIVRYRPGVRDSVFWEQSLRMINRHRLGTWSGRTLVYVAPENPDDPAHWDLVLTGPHEVLRVDGGHSAILRPPSTGPSSTGSTRS